ncbi:MAG: hypothetical protein JWO37_2067 [Acidimicrobiales bacterium]|jgi:DNA-binding protein HU-beta|nr:hypothetical protein [Acidimicrobiales bacterium]
MAEVGDRVTLASAQAAPRVGVVMAVTGSMVRIRWDTGGESSMVPGPGVLSVLPAAAPDKRAPARRAPTAKKKAPVGKKKAPVVRKKAAAAAPPAATAEPAPDAAPPEADKNQPKAKKHKKSKGKKAKRS